MVHTAQMDKSEIYTKYLSEKLKGGEITRHGLE